jgi:hypothetical protein
LVRSNSKWTLPPHEMVGAMHEKIHDDIGRGRVAQTIKKKDTEMAQEKKEKKAAAKTHVFERGQEPCESCKALANEVGFLKERAAELAAKDAALPRKVFPAESFGNVVDVCNGCLHIGGGMAHGECAECKVVAKYEPTKFSDVGLLLDKAEAAGVDVVVGAEKQLVHDAEGALADELDRFEAAVVRKLRGL